jgi:hypothetical protein
LSPPSTTSAARLREAQCSPYSGFVVAQSRRCKVLIQLVAAPVVISVAVLYSVRAFQLSAPPRPHLATHSRHGSCPRRASIRVRRIRADDPARDGGRGPGMAEPLRPGTRMGCDQIRSHGMPDLDASNCIGCFEDSAPRLVGRSARGLRVQRPRPRTASILSVSRVMARRRMGD